MAFSISDDHARQEQVWERVSGSHVQEPYYIKRLLTETTVRADDRRAVYVGAEAYEAAGGIILRDLFEQDSRRLVPGCRAARAAGLRQAEGRCRGDPRRRLEVGRGGHQLPVRPQLRHAPHLGRAAGAERRGDRTLRRAQGRIRQARCRICRGGGLRRGDREQARSTRRRARCLRRSAARSMIPTRWRCAGVFVTLGSKRPAPDRTRLRSSRGRAARRTRRCRGHRP